MLNDEVEQADSRRKRIEQALGAMENDGSAHRLAQEEAEQAQLRLDELEADAALGELREGEQRAAQAALAKARTKAQKALEEARRQASARRGLESRLVVAAERADELRKVRDEVAINIHTQALAEAEEALVDYLDGDELRNLTAEVAKHHAALTSAQPGHSYGPAQIEIRMPTLYCHHDRQRLSRQRMTIQHIPTRA
ncbi:hypothetical protein [Halomonas litopenaei]|uniref:hypothetical protein n=1 Tax=Halomonas litopenaei TaxID=2109328 RepID=UPI001A90991D|nr:hypothetical protein [Halomonas litopenaei]MBN8412992.1 hypothetical protein [Halomonas litopenaei]